MNNKDILESKFFWIFGILYLISMESVALFYQYVLEDAPCALCVQIRAWTMGALISAALYQFVLKNTFVLNHLSILSTIGFLSGGLYTSYLAYGVENGTIFSTCSIGSGFPSWLPLDKWVPFLFEAKGLCGKSPEMLWGLTMTESLLLCFAIPIVVISYLYIVKLINK